MHITVVGGGFGGVKAALEIAQNKRAKVTLISDKADFQYYPALFNTATGGSRDQSWIPLGEIFANYDNVEVIIDTATVLDKEAKTIKGTSGTVYNYDTLILALGSVTTYFGIEGLDKYAFGIKSYDEIARLHHHLLSEFKKPNGADAHYLVIGAGPTGVELASELGSYLKHLKKKYRQPEPRMSVSIIEAAPRVLPRMSEKASAKVQARLKKLGVHVELNKKVEAETADELVVSGRPIKSHTVIWTSGVANSPFFKANESQFNLAPNGRVVVDRYLRADKHIYVIGDNAITPFGGMAQTALHNGVYVAHRILGKKTGAYKPKQPQTVIPVGKGWAIYEFKKIRFGGWLGSLVREAADFIGYKDILPFTRAFEIWRSQKRRSEAVYVTEREATK